MNSINKNQSEENYESLSAAEAVKKIRQLAEKSETCFFSTNPASPESEGARPMSIQEVDESGSLWFLIASDSHTHDDIKNSSQVKLYFQGSAHSDFLYIQGNASISVDKARVEKYWNPIIKTWFTEGKDDPRIRVVEVKPSSGYYWDNKHGNAIAGVKMMIGAALGKTMDDSIEGELKV